MNLTCVESRTDGIDPVSPGGGGGGAGGPDGETNVSPEIQFDYSYHII